MRPETEQLAADILTFPREQRAFLAETLLESLDFDEAFSVSAEWKAEIARRCRELDQGTAELIPGDDVIDEVIKALG
jgi:putative addiction module component (TIGR02574 family)